MDALDADIADNGAIDEDQEEAQLTGGDGAENALDALDLAVDGVERLGPRWIRRLDVGPTAHRDARQVRGVVAGDTRSVT